jgi:hypothetical protein
LQAFFALYCDTLKPQLGQTDACSDICFPHSGHSISAMLFLPFPVENSRILFLEKNIDFCYNKIVNYLHITGNEKNTINT